jgi:uncharacterized protein YkwD
MSWLGNLWNWFDNNDPVPPVVPVPPVPPVNTNDEALLAAHNTERGASYPLVINDKLTKAAQLHAQWMADMNNMSHNEGRATVADRAKAAGYNWNYVGENIAMGYPDVPAVMSGWMHSPGHRANILNKNYKDVGFGVAKSKSGAIYWCADFGRQM